MAKCIFLAGAPERDGLSWDDSTLSSHFESPLKRFLGAHTAPSGTAAELSTVAFPRWRAVDVPTGSREDANKPHGDDPPETRFLLFEEGVASSRDRIHFVEQSLARLHELDSSQIAPAADDTTFVSRGSFMTSIASASSPTSYGSFSTTTPTQSTQAIQHIHPNGATTDLKRIPHADHLLRIAPQTVTVNLLAAVISVSPSRTVRLRKRQGEMDIIELLLGDETRAGFGVSFWLAPADSQRKEPDDMREHMRQLRSGDMVLLQNIALSAFKGCVYGQSLSKRFARNSTTLNLLLAPKGLPAQLQVKYERVQEWSYHFVGRGDRRASVGEGTARSSKRRGEELPPDTQSPNKGE